MTSQFPPAPPMTQAVGTPATFGQRAIALIIDWAVGFGLVIPGIVVLIVGGIAGSGVVVGIGVLLFLLAILASLYIVIVGIGTEGQTPGKRSQGVKVVTDAGTPIGIGGSIIRYIVQSISNAVVFGLPLGYAWMLWDGEKKTLYDKVLNYQAIQVPPGKLFPIFPGAKPF